MCCLTTQNNRPSVLCAACAVHCAVMCSTSELFVLFSNNYLTLSCGIFHLTKEAPDAYNRRKIYYCKGESK